MEIRPVATDAPTQVYHCKGLPVGIGVVVPPLKSRRYELGARLGYRRLRTAFLGKTLTPDALSGTSPPRPFETQPTVAVRAQRDAPRAGIQGIVFSILKNVDPLPRRTVITQADGHLARLVTEVV